MRCQEVLDILGVTRQTLCKYVKTGVIKVRTKPNGQYDYDEEQIYKFINNGVERRNVIYARICPTDNREKLNAQVDVLKQFIFNRGLKVNGIYLDISPSILSSKSTGIWQLIQHVMCRDIQQIYVLDKHIIGDAQLGLFTKILDHYNCKLIEVGDTLPSTYSMDDLMSSLDSDKASDIQLIDEIYNKH